MESAETACTLNLSNRLAKTTRSVYLHDTGVGTSSRTLRFTDEVGLRVGTAETLLPRPQAAIAVRRSEAHAVTLFTREVARRGRREDDKLAPSPSSAASVLQTSGVIQTWTKTRD